jgi:hypothetical protein
MNAPVAQLVTLPAQPLAVQGRSLTAADIRQRVNTIQEVMSAVMKPDVHYGVIPGCKKPSLYKPGSEVLLATFQIATSIHVTDLSTDDCIRYQVRVIGTHAPSGMVVGEGIGECSSNEEKYKWRKAYDEEWNATPENRRRIKLGKYKDKQVRTEPADVANTILKMAKKRAQIDMTLTATGASDCFEQDVEDLPEGIRAASQHEPTPEEKAAQRKAVHDDALSRHKESVDFIKDRIGADDMDAAVQEWADIPQVDQMALWLAPAKGGYLTTEERQKLRDAQGKQAAESSHD